MHTNHEPVRPYRIQVADVQLDDLRERLGRTRYPDELAATDWDYGVPVSYLEELVETWRTDYDWRHHETRLNRYPQFVTTIDGQEIHFLHTRAAAGSRATVLLTHGWPGSFVEFLDVVDLLRDDFDLVVPSLPGYGFSGPTTERGWDVGRIARAFAELMTRLGYEGYIAQGGDWGAQVSTRLAVDDPHCVALHLNMPIAYAPRDAVSLSAAEQADLNDLQAFQRDEAAYSLQQGTRPQTLGAALADSPAGMLAWIVEKFRAWSDCGGELESVFTREQILTNATIYWVTNTITSSMRLYYETRATGYAREASSRIDVPTGVGRYPREILRYPRAWVEQRYNVTRWIDQPRGGHFAALEQPELFAADLRAFCESIVANPSD
jgi:epoxide hydrolase